MVNLAVFLESLDDNGDSSDGIQIAEQVAALFEEKPSTSERDRSTFEREHFSRKCEMHKGISVHLIQFLYHGTPLLISTNPHTSRQTYLVKLASKTENLGNTFVETRTYDDRGQLVHHSPAFSGEEITLRMFDRNGYIIRIQTPDGRTISSYEYDSIGNTTRWEFDRDSNGSADSFETYAYDELGNRVRTELDIDRDGSTEDISTFTYTLGRMTRLERDQGANGTIDRIETYTYDESGHLLREEVDRNADGSAERIHTYTYNEQGNRTREDTDRDGDGSADQSRIYVYHDATNNYQLQEERLDMDGDGTPEQITTYSYDENGNLRRTEKDDGGNGSIDSTVEYAYDEHHNMTRFEVDLNADGTPEQIATITYEKTGWGVLSSTFSESNL